MKKSELSVILCQLISTDNISENDKQIKGLLESIPNVDDIDIISLPENCFFMRMREGDEVKYLTLDDPIFNYYKDFAVKNDLLIHFGATPLEIDGKYYNATVVVTPEGAVQSPYQKIHLFDIDLQDKKPIRESDAFVTGSKPSIIEFRGWNLGFTICYDLRFSELYLYYQLHGVDCVFIPSAFLVQTGKIHWEVLNRARAIEGQYYVVSSAQGGQHSPTRFTYGHSLAVDPWGHIIAEIKDDSKSSWTLTRLKSQTIEEMRSQIPMANHRRLKVEFSKK